MPFLMNFPSKLHLRESVLGDSGRWKIMKYGAEIPDLEHVRVLFHEQSSLCFE